VLPPHQQRVAGLAFAPDGKTLATASFDGTAKLWDMPTLQCKHVFKGGKIYVTSICFSLDGRRLAVGSDNSTVRVWDTTTMQEVALLKAGAGINPIETVLFPDDDNFFTFVSREGAYVWRAASFAESDVSHN